MSVIWSGVTEEGAVVPVQVTAEGKVVAVGDGPEGDYLKVTGGNLTGDLTLGTDQITLDAADGSATFSGPVKSVNGATVTLLTDSKNSYFDSTSGIVFRTNGTTPAAAVYPNGDLFVGGGSSLVAADPSGNVELNANGSASFAGTVQVTDGIGTIELNKAGLIRADRTSTTAGLFQGQLNGTPTSSIKADGSATFAGDVVIGSRGEKWLIRESNGVAMLVQQALRQPMEKLRDLPNELDLIEAALSEVMDKLRMVPPAGWPVWDGSNDA